MNKKIFLTEYERRVKAEYARKWRKLNPEAVAASAKRSRIKNKEKVQATQRKWTQENPEKRRASYIKYYEKEKLNIREKQLLKQFGIDFVQYNLLLELQNGICAICGGGPDAKGKSFAVDHCHESGKIRGLLCRGCNVGIGNLKDNVDILQKAIAYLLKNKEFI